jgi:hypothetical protein
LLGETEDNNEKQYSWNLGLESVTSEHSLGVSANVKVKVTLEQAMKVQRGSRGIAVLFL